MRYGLIVLFSCGKEVACPFWIGVGVSGFNREINYMTGLPGHLRRGGSKRAEEFDRRQRMGFQYEPFTGTGPGIIHTLLAKASWTCPQGRVEDV